MSEDDILSKATRALRDAGPAPREDVRRTRERVLETVRASKRRRSRAWTVAFPIAAVMVATTAWAAGTGRLETLFPALRSLVAPEPEPEPANQPAPAAAPAPAPVPVPAASEPEPEPAASEEPEPEPAASEEPEPAAPEPAPANQPAPAPAIPSVAPATPKPAPKPSNAKPTSEPDDLSAAHLALYKKAHKLHFTDQNHAAALVAWDEYLQAAPGGALVVEARYNRAICLVKLGRRDEAKAALTPFAEGKIGGGYRQTEAQALIDAL